MKKVAQLLALLSSLPCASAQVDVPLRLWRNATSPQGLELGISNGVAVGDFDADGWVDVASIFSGNLWRNVKGRNWELVGDLTTTWPTPLGGRYSSSFGDFDLDGLPDLATEPRGAGCLHLLRNLGGGRFRDLAWDPQWVDDQACNAESETICWGDVDGDGDLDLFLPVYPTWTSFPSIGNHFWINEGPDADPPFRLREATTSSGLDNNPTDSERPEGAQMLDVDGDGDLDLYTHGTLFQNSSTVGVPSFSWMAESGSGIGNHDVLDEGAAFADHDLDGDFDLFIAYVTGPPGVCIWENRGDGTFFDVGPGVIASPGQGLALGLSIADWDLDGDMDWTTRQIFRKNMFVELGGVRRYEVATHNIPAGHLGQAVPCWFDWDKDGDLDSALSNMGSQARLYDSVLYDGQPLHLRRYLRVKPISEYEGARVESEYGAEVELLVAGESGAIRRRHFNASGSGYVNQSEYTIHLALPPHPNPDVPEEDVELDVLVTFPSLPEQGRWRVDGSINPILGGVEVATLPSREFIVFRDGRVELDGVVHQPVPGAEPWMTTVGGELSQPDPMAGLPAPVAPPTGDHWVGIELAELTSDLRLRELVLEAQLALPISCGGAEGNVLVVDVTDPQVPFVAPGGVLDLVTSDRNHRTLLPVDVPLEAGRSYRLVARVSRIRPGAGAPVAHDELTYTGSVSFPHPGSCPVAEAAAAALDVSERTLTVRYSRR